MQYFDHSSTAGSDDKIIALRLECGGAAVDAYWVVLEQIYRDETELDIFGNQHVKRSVCHRLNIDEKTLETWISSMLEIGLLFRTGENGESVMSQRAEENITAYKQRCETARQNGKKGGRKPTRKPTAKPNGNQTLTDAETDRETNKTKQNKGIGLDELNQIPTASDGADAEGSAPTAAKAPQCPQCGGPLRLDAKRGEFSCAACGSKVALSDVGSCLGEVTA